MAINHQRSTISLQFMMWMQRGGKTITVFNYFQEL